MRNLLLGLLFSSQIFTITTYADAIVPKIVRAAETGMRTNKEFVIRLESNGNQWDVVDSLFRLLGRTGREVNGDEIRLFPLSLQQHYLIVNEKEEEKFVQNASIFVNDGEYFLSDNNRHLILKGQSATLLFDLLKNNLFNNKISSLRNDFYEQAYKLGQLICGVRITKIRTIRCDLNLQERE